MTALVVRPLAEADLDEAFAWYESRSVGLGVEPELGAVAEEPGEPERHLRTEGAPLAEQFVDGLPGHA